MLGNQDLMHFKELGHKAAFLLNQITVGSLTNLKERKEKVFAFTSGFPN